MKRFLFFLFFFAFAIQLGCQQPKFILETDRALAVISKVCCVDLTNIVDAERTLSGRFDGMQQGEIRRFFSSLRPKEDGFAVEYSYRPGYDILRFRRKVREGDMAAFILFIYNASGVVNRCSLGFELK